MATSISRRDRVEITTGQPYQTCSKSGDAARSEVQQMLPILTPEHFPCKYIMVQVVAVFTSSFLLRYWPHYTTLGSLTLASAKSCIVSTWDDNTYR